VDRWRERYYLIIFAVIVIVIGIVTLALPRRDVLLRVDMLGSVAIVGGFAMIVIAITRGDDKG
jgi:uncharacterized membrane protein HdeD (DUF308 family)